MARQLRLARVRSEPGGAGLRRACGTSPASGPAPAGRPRASPRPLALPAPPPPPAAALLLPPPATLPPGSLGREREKVLPVGGRGAASVRHPGAAPARAARGPGGPCIRRRPPLPRWISVRTACSATWRTCRSSPSSRGRSAGASRCAPGRSNCPQGAWRLARAPTPSRPLLLPEAARDPLGVGLDPPSSRGRRVTLSPPLLRRSFGSPSSDPHPRGTGASDALGPLVPRPSPARAPSLTRPQERPVQRRPPSRPSWTAVAPLPSALRELPLEAAAALSPPGCPPTPGPRTTPQSTQLRPHPPLGDAADPAFRFLHRSSSGASAPSSARPPFTSHPAPSPTTGFRSPLDPSPPS